MAITPEDLVRREVCYCVSSLVHTLAKHDGPSLDLPDSDDLAQLTEQAFALSTPIDDWEEAAIEAGFSFYSLEPGIYRWRGRDEDQCRDWATLEIAAQEACAIAGIEPYAREVFEHWIVSDWLADELEKRGEKVVRDFAGMTIWARTTTGQAIYADAVMEAIATELEE